MLDMANNSYIHCHQILVVGPSCRIAEAEVMKALKHSKIGKTARPSGVMSERIKVMGDIGME